MSRAADLAKQALAAGLKLGSIPVPNSEGKIETPQLTISPGTTQIRDTIQRDGQMAMLEKLGGHVLPTACGPCIGQWKRDPVEFAKQGNNKEVPKASTKKEVPNSILTSFNRNFAGRNDGNNKTHNFLTSPEMVMAMTVAGDMCFNPLTDSITKPDGTKFKFTAPTGLDSLPSKGFVSSSNAESYQAPVSVKEAATVPIAIAADSARLQLMAPFTANDKPLLNMPVLIKVRGKCTTDHINAAGPWLRFRGHLANSAMNTLIGAVNHENGKVNSVENQLQPGTFAGVPNVAKEYQAQGLKWVVVGDSNYGEGSARELAAIQPRFLGCGAVITRSFARIHETNLKRQGVLPLKFKDPADYDKITGQDRVSLPHLDTELKPFSDLTLVITKKDGSSSTIKVTHTLNDKHIEWYRLGSSLNYLKSKML